MKAATVPRQGAHGARLLVIDEMGLVAHRRAADLPTLLHRGDLVVANDAATVPASLRGTHLPTGLPIEIRLAGRRSLASPDVGRFTAVVFGAGDYRTPTEHRPEPPQLHPGDDLALGPLRATVIELLGHRRLVELRLNASAEEIWEGIARHGRPIQYAYVPEPLAIWDTWTSIASRPVAFEAPSAGFVLDWATLRAIRSRGAQFATLTHAAGISSTGDAALDALLPLRRALRDPADNSVTRLSHEASRWPGRRRGNNRCSRARARCAGRRLDCVRRRHRDAANRGRVRAAHRGRDRVRAARIRQQPLRAAAGVSERWHARTDVCRG